MKRVKAFLQECWLMFLVVLWALLAERSFRRAVLVAACLIIALACWISVLQPLGRLIADAIGGAF